LENEETQDSVNDSAQSGNVTDSAADEEGLHVPVSQHGIPRIPRPIYVFQPDIVCQKSLGIPKGIPRPRASFEAEPDWLDTEEAFWLDDDEVRNRIGGIEEKDGFKLAVCGESVYVSLNEFCYIAG
jgi:hypothetical protein